MISKSEAIIKVEKHLEKANSNPDRYEFEIPVYKSWLKKIKKYYQEYKWKKEGWEPNRRFIEWEVEPDYYEHSKVFLVVLKNYIKDLEVCWSVPYCAQLYKETLHVRYQGTGAGPIYVDKEDGKMYQTGSNPLVNWPESFKKFKNSTKTKKFPHWKPIEE